MKDKSRVHYQNFSHIFLYITERCQLRCKHCYLGERLNKPMTMKIDQIKEYLSYFHKIGADHLTLLGGEPTIHSNFEEIITYAHSIGYSNISIDSNGISINKLLKINNGIINYIRISLDGPDSASHDFIRGVGCFEKTITNINKLIKSGFKVAITCTISKHNINLASKILDLTQELGVTLLNFHVLSEEGYGKQMNSYSLVIEEWIKFCQYLESVKDNYKFSIWYPPTWAYNQAVTKYVREGYKGCLGISMDRLSVFPDGRCYICSVLFDTSLNFGVIDNNGFRLNRNTNEFELFANSFININDNFLSGCPAERIIMRDRDIDSENITSICRCWKSQI